MPFIKPFKKEKIEIEHPHLSKTLQLKSDTTALDIDVVGGNLSIEAGRAGEVHLEVLWKDNYPLPEFSLEEEVLTLRAKGLSSFIAQKYPYVYNLKVPKEMPIKVKMSAGVISLDGLSGPLDLSIATGGLIESSCSSRQVKAHVSAGNIRLLGLCTEELKAKTYLGSVEVLFREVFEKANIEMSTGLGDVKALFPAYFKPSHKRKKVYNARKAICNASTAIGDVKIGVLD